MRTLRLLTLDWMDEWRDKPWFGLYALLHLSIFVTIVLGLGILYAYWRG